MAWPTWTPAQQPSQEGTNVQATPQAIVNNFGDGYASVTPKGINNIAITATLTWSQISQSLWNTLSLELFSYFYTPFLYTLPGGTSPLQWRCTKVSNGYGVAGVLQNCTAELTRDYTPAA